MSLAVALSTLLLPAFSPAPLLLDVKRPASGTWSRTQCGGPSGNASIPSQWASEVTADKVPLPEYPRPMFMRGSSSDRDKGDPATWQSLNGLWEWQPDTGGAPPFGKTLASSILVPFPIESCLSGVAPRSSAEYVAKSWYRTQISVSKPADGGKTLLHFEAVDWQAVVWVGGSLAVNHTGGFDAFSVDITDAVAAQNGPIEVIVSVYDPSDEGAQPNGKQRISAIDSPGGDTYTPNSGLWQTVWLERVPSTFISAVQIATNTQTATLVGSVGGDTATLPLLTYEVLDGDGGVLATASAKPGVAVELEIPNARLWSPASPHLYDLRVVLASSAAAPSSSAAADSVLAYFGMRTFAVANASATATPGESAGAVMRPLLNGQFTFLAGWLDQSFWPDGIYTAPTDAALAFDLSSVRTFGLNMVRLHQKVNSERWYYHADKLGVLVLQDAVQKYGHASAATIPFFVADLTEMIRGRGNHPSIVQWETFNEGDCWGVFNAPGAAYSVADVVALARKTDWQRRPVDTDSGGGANSPPLGDSGDVNDVHSYPQPSDPKPTAGRYAMIGEFGGIGAFVAGKEWVPSKCHTYLKVDTPQEEADRYTSMATKMIAQRDHLSASVYTQITDVELECDGFLNYDRTNKFTEAQTKAIAAANQKLIVGA